MADLEIGPILDVLRVEFERIIGNDLYEIVLFGSRARGDARADSDVDLLLVIDGEFDYGELMRRTSHVVSRVSLEYDVVVSRAFIRRKEYATARTPFVMNVRREGVPV